MHDVIERNKTAIAEVCRKHGVRRLDVFGSGARGIDFDPARSDVDFIVEYDERVPTLSGFFALRDALSNLLGRRVDLVSLQGLTNPYVKADIERSREQVYAA